MSEPAARVAPKSGELQDGKVWFTRKGHTVTLGITSAGLEEIGAADDVSFGEEGQDFESGEVVATVEGSLGKIEVLAPATGTIDSLNEALTDDPDVVTDDPLEEGWIVKFEVQDKADLLEYEG